MPAEKQGCETTAKEKGFKILTYRGRALSGMNAEELRSVVDDMADVYRRRLIGIRKSFDKLYESSGEIAKATISLEVEKYSDSIVANVKRLSADLGLDVETGGS